MKQSGYGSGGVKYFVVVIGLGAPEDFCKQSKSVENALEQVVDTASLAVNFVDKILSGLSAAAQRSPRRWKDQSFAK